MEPLPPPKIIIHKNRYMDKDIYKAKKNFSDILEKLKVEKKIKERHLRIMNRQKNINYIYKNKISENNKYIPKSSLQLIRTKLKPINFKRDNMRPSYKIKPWL